MPHPDGFERDEPPSAGCARRRGRHAWSTTYPAYALGGPATGSRAVRARPLARPSRRALRAPRAEVAADAAAKRREPVAGARPRSAPEERDEHASERADEHSRDRSRRILVLAEEVADARAVARPDARVVLANVVPDDERRVVLDPRTAAHRADEVVDLLARAPRLGQSRARVARRTRRLARRARGAGRSSNEIRAVPQVVGREGRGVRLPRAGGVAARVLRLAR